jgi:hypothetical protein
MQLDFSLGDSELRNGTCRLEIETKCRQSVTAFDLLLDERFGSNKVLDALRGSM